MSRYRESRNYTRDGQGFDQDYDYPPQRRGNAPPPSRQSNDGLRPPAMNRTRNSFSGYDERPSQRQLHQNNGYGDDAEDDATNIGTDLSMMPPHPAHNERAHWGPDQIYEFDKTLPPDAVPPAQPRSGAATLGVPGSNMRPRASSMDDRYGRPKQSSLMPPAAQAPSSQPRRGQPPPGRQPAYQQPQRPAQSYSSYRDYSPQHDDDEANDSDEDDKFTAISMGVDDDGDDREADYDPRYGQGYGQPPPSAPHRRAASFDNRGYGSAPPPAAPPGRRQAPPPAYNTNSGLLAAPSGPPPRPSSAGSNRPSNNAPVVQGYQPPPPPSRQTVSATPAGSVPEDTPEEKALIRLLKDMNFSMALKDFHNTFGIGVAKTLVASDGLGHAYCKIHCKKLPRPDELSKEPHLAKYWIPITGSRWHFATESHKVEIVWRTVALAAYETAAKFGAVAPR